ncbi:MAG TPA: IS1634 family transposase [Candidatus Aminicenantes bacterium]|nr:IS1634 family transposase [Candidatus Aminicenantes bacterium]
MFVRVKPSGRYKYLQIVENSREGKKVKQHVLCTLGRLDRLTTSGQIDGLAKSLLRFSQKIEVINLYNQNQLKILKDVSIGPSLVFERIWKELGIDGIIKEMALNRNYQFDLERAIFLTVLHRLFAPGSDRAAEKWKQDFSVSRTEDIELHQLYRAMGWIGESIDIGISKETKSYQQFTKDRIEYLLFARNRDLFSTLAVVFFDTTSIYFEGEGGHTIGEYGHSKDQRPDLKQMVVGVVLDSEGRPICCELLPGNISDAKTLLPVIIRIKQRFGINSFCIVADRGMISKKTIETLESPSFRIDYIFGCRMRRQKEVRNDVLGRRGGTYKEISAKRRGRSTPLLLKVKEVKLNGKRYIICYNPEQARKDAEDRKAIVLSLGKKLKQGDKSLVGNKGYRKYLKSNNKDVFEIDYDKLKEEELFDGKWVLRTNTSYPAEEVALQYKELWMVEQAFRTVKSVLETRPIYHKCDETIRGHVFCSFLALIVMKELYSRLELKGHHFEWNDILRDLQALREVTLQMNDQVYYLRTELRGTCYDVLNAVGVAIPPRVRH